MYCGSRSRRAAVHERLFFSLVYCGASCSAAAAVGVDSPQFEPFYMVPKYQNILLFEEKTGKLSSLFASKCLISILFIPKASSLHIEVKIYWMRQFNDSQFLTAQCKEKIFMIKMLTCWTGPNCWWSSLHWSFCCFLCCFCSTGVYSGYTSQCTCSVKIMHKPMNFS